MPQRLTLNPCGTFIRHLYSKDTQGEVSQGTYFSTSFIYSGHPIYAAVGLKNIEIFERDNVLGHTCEVIPYFQARLAAIKGLSLVVDVRGKGLVGCLECALSTYLLRLITAKGIWSRYSRGAKTKVLCFSRGGCARSNN